MIKLIVRNREHVLKRNIHSILKRNFSGTPIQVPSIDEVGKFINQNQY